MSNFSSFVLFSPGPPNVYIASTSDSLSTVLGVGYVADQPTLMVGDVLYIDCFDDTYTPVPANPLPTRHQFIVVAGNSLNVFSGSPGNAGSKHVSDNSLDVVASVSGTPVLGNVAIFNDIVGTIKDAGLLTKGYTSSGSAGGDYSTASAVYVDIDAVNLTLTSTVAATNNLLINASISLSLSVAASSIVMLSLSDSVNGNIAENINSLVSGQTVSVSMQGVIPGDGLSHTITLQWKTSAGTLSGSNTTAANSPKILASVLLA